MKIGKKMLAAVIAGVMVLLCGVPVSASIAVEPDDSMSMETQMLASDAAMTLTQSNSDWSDAYVYTTTHTIETSETTETSTTSTTTTTKRQQDTYGVLTYKLLSNGTIEITDCESDATNVDIPSKIGGVKVTSIGYDAFNRCYSLTSITIPDSVTSIGEYAFACCDSLTSIIIPNGVTSVGYCAFYGCDSLTSIAIPDSVTNIGEYVFYGCTSLTSITIPDSVTSIGDKAFSYCTSLTEIQVAEKNQMYESYDNVLYNKDLTKLIACPGGKESIRFSNNVTCIGDSAFENCTSLTSISIPDGVTSIGEDAFWSCDNLISITIPDVLTPKMIQFEDTPKPFEFAYTI